MPDAHGNRVTKGKKIQIGRLRLEKASGAVKVDRGSAKMVKLGPIGAKIDCSWYEPPCFQVITINLTPRADLSRACWMSLEGEGLDAIPPKLVFPFAPPATPSKASFHSHLAVKKLIFFSVSHFVLVKNFKEDPLFD
ncbi:hypothetical protein FOXG_01594 [Fusarium oxysporum f. sp. lycopersici 4287]|uniref:Uncharacterized protein n=3 Tax=Fusarium oxysporum TaxID=5507 RepID=A0A0J9UBH7_FUSO4|nr:hypothetical protein FOXG_01594 [Fusarium oxysporum f. sp. lycopersici 4287]XP_018234416.1 hypothetical protein FOXG_01594 [Fusarium oxysporum f. sp. lycopersici 4287]XP_018234417.1 hypothetical protein FOXG_01594 [Fusarium oxysporum f. sp. lycopersici 4287]XP_018234418.1 hypothetical protein FOXG_01594 [Fusarium oxysporum f. sp. lycopersici 4287]XP_018234419.1 hypothetical protein FOXG_01594 [Fusarium oxysporum f. sp. lycopersici 4287]EXK42748.1 hypothetical protein FOMG_05543 [Fusarium ox